MTGILEQTYDLFKKSAKQMSNCNILVQAILPIDDRPRGYKLLSCSTELSMKFHLLIKTKLLKNKDFFLLTNSPMLNL